MSFQQKLRLFDLFRKEIVNNHLYTFCMCVNKIMLLVTDDWVYFIVFVLPEEVKVYNLFGKKVI